MTGFSYYAKRLLPFAAAYFLIETVIRLALFVWSYSPTRFIDIAHIFGLGFFFDAAVLAFFVLPFCFYLTLLPKSWHGKLFDRFFSRAALYFFTGLLLFGAIAEYLFWDEFTTRFNFIAVDYLVYTQEVWGNIQQSYPLPWLVSALLAATLVMGTLILRAFAPGRIETPRFAKRLNIFMVFVAIAFGFYFAANIGLTQWNERQVANELSANGVYNLFYAFNNNELDYPHFYKSEDVAQVNLRMRNLEHEPEAPYINNDPADLTKHVHYHAPEKHKNVMLVVMESLSAEYMASFGNTYNLTPNLDRLAKEGLFFTKLYATGNRTVRGLEAVTLSVPPTPGQSIVRRPHNEELFSLGYIFQDRGYDTRFIYGGYGYFDNMNYFFAHNGFEILDRAQMPKEDIEFANVWGVCDEDLYKQAIKAADQSVKAGKPFMHLIMTTSNHRPYTYPKGRIDIEPPGGRHGGVKYADYAIGQFLKAAKTKPWFKDTVFVFVADHTAGSAGKLELSLSKYHIPLIMYAPGFIKPQRFTNTASQIDTAPILLGLMKFNYYSKFYGEDLLNDPDEIPHAFVATYQKIALVRGDEIVELSPRQQVESYKDEKKLAKHDEDQELIDDTIAYYQYAANWRERMKKLPSTIVQEEAHVH